VLGCNDLLKLIFTYIDIQDQRRYARVSKLFHKNLTSTSSCIKILIFFNPRALLIPNLVEEPDLLSRFANTTLRHHKLKKMIPIVKKIIDKEDDELVVQSVISSIPWILCYIKAEMILMGE
jgi:hypothetical protein